jgi:1,4-dihydroxy-2-naphthoate octaprenyltransferase
MADTFTKRIRKYFLAARPAFLTASVVPVLTGSAAGFAVTGTFDWPLFILAVVSIMLLHSGANLGNDYYDHISGNDWANKNPTPFSGGSRFIQDGVLSAKTILDLSIACLAIGAAIGMIIVLLTKSAFIFVLGVTGCLGGFFYTAPPLKLGYRSLGEIVIAFLFGLLPVTGSFYLQAGMVDWLILLPAGIVAILIFLVILINEFADRNADAAVKKRTLVVIFGVEAAVWIYRAAVIASYLLAAIAIFLNRRLFFAGLFYLLTVPVAFAAIRFANKKDLSEAGKVSANKTTILLHLVGGIAIAAGFIVSGICNLRAG